MGGVIYSGSELLVGESSSNSTWIRYINLSANALEKGVGPA